MHREVMNFIEVLSSIPRENRSVQIDSQFQANKVGRNVVWEIRKNQSEVYCYIKFFASQAWFERERYGRNLTDALSKSNLSCISGEVIATCSSHRAIASLPIPGRCLSDCLKDGFRMDRNPLLMLSRKRTAGLQAFESAIEWLRTIHKQPVTPDPFFYDHSCKGVLDRIAILVNRLSEQLDVTYRNALLSLLEVQVCDCNTPPALGYGDVAFVNFFISDGKCGAVDFEDLGIGSPTRDFALMLMYAEDMHQRFLYRGTSVLIKKLQAAMSGCKICQAIFRTELILHRLERYRPGVEGSDTAMFLKAFKHLENVNHLFFQSRS